jgi:uncharacterized membrane protein
MLTIAYFVYKDLSTRSSAVTFTVPSPEDIYSFERIIEPMGRTVPTYRMYLESILDRWMDYRRALREKDRELFDEVMNRARQHASAASYCAHLDPVETAFLSIFLEMQREIAELRAATKIGSD